MFLLVEEESKLSLDSCTTGEGVVLVVSSKSSSVLNKIERSSNVSSLKSASKPIN